jgi:hypothetical protein
MPRRQEHDDITEERLSLDVRALHRAGDLRGDEIAVVRWSRGPYESSVGVTFLDGDGARVFFQDHTGQAIGEHIAIEWTPCNYGGTRPWWCCPRCGGRCAIVYAHPFVCRRCANLTYKSSRSDAFTRACDKNHGLRRRIGWADGEWEPPKPKGMHWQTWERRIAECREAEEAMVSGLRAWIDCFEP